MDDEHEVRAGRAECIVNRQCKQGGGGCRRGIRHKDIGYMNDSVGGGVAVKI